MVSSNPAHGGGVLDTPLCDKVCQWITGGYLFSLGTPVSSNNNSAMI